MRSRFSAFVRGDWPYLWRTLHPSHTDRSRTHDEWLSAMKASTAGVRYRTLRVLDVAPPDRDEVAHVLFHVVVSMGRRDMSFAEHSHFAHDGFGWRYLDGVTLRNRDLPKPIGALTFSSFAIACRR